MKRHLFRSLFLHPTVALPIAAGMGAGVLSWMGGGITYLTAIAVLGIAGGVAWMLTRTFMQVEELTNEALLAQRSEDRALENKQLDELARQLRTDRDHRTQDSLTLLRSLRDTFETAAQKPGIELRSARMGEQVSQVFGVAIEQLRETFRLWELSESVVGDERDKILAQREIILAEVVTTSEQLRSVVTQFQELTREDLTADLSTLGAELEATMRVARRTEERIRELDHPTTNTESFIQD